MLRHIITTVANTFRHKKIKTTTQSSNNLINSKELIKFVQNRLNLRGLNAGPADGIIGPQTRQALSLVKNLPQDWSQQRRIVGFIQLLCQEKGIQAGPIDGFWGPQTEFGFSSLKYLLENGQLPDPWRSEENKNNTINSDETIWPIQNQAELVRYFGEVGQNQATLELPYPHKLAWDLDTTITRFSCHEKVHDSVKQVLERVLDHYGQEKIQELGLDLWGGCLNVRKIRGGSKYSTHSWGIAIDYDPAHNKLTWGKDKARLAKPEYVMWWNLWEQEGWTSLGRTKNYDWMHVQAALIV